MLHEPFVSILLQGLTCGYDGAFSHSLLAMGKEGPSNGWAPPAEQPLAHSSYLHVLCLHCQGGRSKIHAKQGTLQHKEVFSHLQRLTSGTLSLHCLLGELIDPILTFNRLFQFYFCNLVGSPTIDTFFEITKFLNYRQ